MQRQRGFDSERSAVIDYVRHGRRAGLSPHPLFEPATWDKRRWRERAGDPFSLYLSAPQRGSRRLHPVWDQDAYQRDHPTAAKHQYGLLGHVSEHASPSTSMTLDLEGHPPVVVSWAGLRDHLFEAARQWAESNALAGPRWSERWDDRAEKSFRARARGVELPVEAQGFGEPLVSVVMPAWNRAPQLRRAVRSLQAQSLRGWELIIVDDGSTDDTALVADGLAAYDPRIRVLREQHRGVSATRNSAIAAARGRWLAFLDTDNTWEPSFLELAVRGATAAGSRAGYAAMRSTRRGGTRYRAYDGGLDALRVGNHIDLNVLVVETDLVREVGGFTEDLRRTVDYDLVLKLAHRTSVPYLPFVGADYSDDTADVDRISVREPLTWDFAVRARYLVDWEALRAHWSSPEAPQRGVSAVVPSTGDVMATAATLAGLLSDRYVEEVVVVDPGSRRANALALSLLTLTDRRVQVHRSAADVGTPLGVDLGLALVTRATTVLCQAGVVPAPGCVEALVALIDDEPDCAAAQPLLIGLDGAVDNAGVDLVGASCTPLPLFRGHPVEDVAGLGVLTVPAAGGEILVARTRELVQVGGVDARMAGVVAWTDLSLRLRHRPTGTVAARTDVVARRVRGPFTPALASGDAGVFHERWAGSHRPADHKIWSRAGFDLVHVRTTWSGRPPVTSSLTPVLRRPQRLVRDGPGAGSPSLRWALRIAAPAGPRGDAWGDRHFAEALARSLRRLGQDVAVHAREAVRLPTTYLDDVEVVIRGLDVVPPDPAKVSILWVISHPEDVTVRELGGFDAVFAASEPWSTRMTEQSGRDVVPLLQCTDPTLFHPGVADADGDPPVLFLGNSRNIYRPVVRHVVEAGIPLQVVGAGWERFLPDGVVTSTFLPNDEVAAAYRRAGVVLNDHWKDMRTEGFCSNRLFDVTAAGGRALTDPVDGVEELFGGSVRSWADPPSLVQMLTAPHDEVFAGEEQRVENAHRIARDHSFNRRAEELLAIAVGLWENG